MASIPTFTLSGFLIATLCLGALGQELARFADTPITACYSDVFVDANNDACDALPKSLSRGRKAAERSNWSDERLRTPAMIGDFFGGRGYGLLSERTLDRLMVVANDLDVPTPLGSNALQLSISEPGPVGIFSTTVHSTQEISQLLIGGSPFPPVTLVGTSSADATLTTLNTISQIQSQLAGTALAYDVILLQDPGGSYRGDLATAFFARTGQTGNIIFDATASGALLQAGADTLVGGEDLDAFYFYDYVIRINTHLQGPAGGATRLKIAEGGTVLPQDRVFFRYNYFDNVRGGRNLNRFTPGFERSLFDGLASFELRAPFVTDATGTATLDGNALTSGTETRFGNLNLISKLLLADTGTLAISGGTGLSLPTASDTNVNLASGASFLNIDHSSVYVQPFVGWLYTPTRNVYAHGFVQCDIAASGDSVGINSTGAGLSHAGRLNEPNYLYADIGLGYWLYRDPTASRLSGIIPTVELHHTNSLGAGDTVSAGPIQLSTSGDSTSLTSLVVGNTFEFRQRSQLTVGYATPLGGASDRAYDGAFRLMLSHSR